MDVDKIKPNSKNKVLLFLIALGPSLSLVYDLIVHGEIVKYLRYGDEIAYSDFGAVLITIWSITWALALFPTAFLYTNISNPVRRWMLGTENRKNKLAPLTNGLSIVAVSTLVVGWVSQW